MAPSFSVPARFLAGALLLQALASGAFSDEWPHYRGPLQNGISTEAGWGVPKNAAPVLWKASVGIGTSSVTVAGGRLFTMGHEGEKDVVRCLDVGDGHELWRYEHKMSLDPNLFEGGTRSTPTVSGSSVYTLSHEGHLICFSTQTGRVLWHRHLINDYAGRKPEWGYSGAPLVYGEMLIVDSGGDGASTVALNRQTGELLWKSGSDKPGYASPIVVSLEAQPVLLLFKAEDLVANDPKSGRELWRFPWKTGYDINAATPLLVGAERLLISSGYNTGAAVLEVKGGQPKELWRNKLLRAHINSPVFVNGAVFGIDGNTGGGNLVCLDPLTGARRWEEKSVKGGGLIAANGRLIIVSEKGDLVIAEASGEGFRQLSRQPALTRRTWAQPVLSDGRLFLRDNLGSLVCLDLRGGR